ncbi:hypothetical protein A2U01_0063760, partial [Trifolium medium]|nr:hypothetical protein [Trifolium medium]
MRVEQCDDSRTTSAWGQQGDSGRMAVCCNNMTVVEIAVWQRQRD